MRLTTILAIGFAVLISGCVDIQGPEMESLAPNDILSRIDIRSAAILIAKGDSHAVRFGIYSMGGEPIQLNWDSIEWSSSESQVVKVTPSGVIHGIKASDGPIKIVVQYRHKYVTKRDSVQVYVTEHAIDADRVRLIAIDSTRVGSTPSSLTPEVRVRVDLYNGDTPVEIGTVIPIQVAKPVSAYLIMDGGPAREPVYDIQNSYSFIGHFWVRTSVNIYGNETSDSLQFTGLYGATTKWFSVPDLTLPTTNLPPNLDTVPLELFQPCSFVLLRNNSTDTVDFVFSDSAASSTGCKASPLHWNLSFGGPGLIHGQFIGGNVLSMPPSSGATRQSNTSGVIVYRVRKSSSKEFIPSAVGHYKQLQPDV